MVKINIYGQALFEVVIALGVALLIIVAVISASVNSIKNSDSSKNVNVATRYSQEATEWLRGQRDLGWATFLTQASLSPGKIWCMNGLTPSLTVPTSQNVTSCQGSTKVISGTIFNRYVTLTILDETTQNIIQADVVTYWTDTQGAHFAPSSTKFTNWVVPPACLGKNTACSTTGGTPCCSGLTCNSSSKKCQQ
ncbi:hypothetical protein HY045_00085 [Candidatus Woesebacteria bacterium]|nr:hypothetical protein [Candidatus Woesebacteria bacterium]